MKRLSSKGLKLLGVKLDPADYDRLIYESSVKQISISDLVRGLIRDHQHRGAQAEGMQDELSKLRNEIRKQRRELALGIEVILSHGGQVSSEEAREWVVKTFGIRK